MKDNVKNQEKVNNEDAVKYLKHYFNLDKPLYAVMLTGKWGCGKTWFIKNLIEKHKPKKATNNDFIYISLYGLTDLNDISLDILSKADVKNIAGKSWEWLKKIIPAKGETNSTKNTSPPDPISQAKDLGLSYYFGDNIKDKLLDHALKFATYDKATLIFDDMERCSINMRDLLGYINRFVEHNHSRVIIICNDEELLPANEDKKMHKQAIKSLNNETNEIFNAYKEKLIGYTVNIESNIDNALNHFISLVKDKRSKRLLNDHRMDILKSFSLIGRHNLRALRQSIIHFPYFMKNFSNEITDYLEKNPQRISRGNANESSIGYIIGMYFFITLGDRVNAFNKDTWHLHCTEYYNGDYESYDPMAKVESENEGIQFTTIEHEALLGLLWYPAVINNVNVYDHLYQTYKSMKIADKSKNKHLWSFIKNGINLDKSEVEENYKNLIKEIRSKSKMGSGEIMHSYGILLWLSNRGIIDMKKHDIEEVIKEKFSKSFNKSKFSFTDEIDYYSMGWGGHTFFEGDSKEMKEMFQYFINEQNKNRRNKDKEYFLKLVNDLTAENLRTISNGLMNINNGGQFLSMPFLSYIDIDNSNKNTFFDDLFKLHHFEIGYLVYSLEERYNMRTSDRKLGEKFYAERDFISFFENYFKRKTNQKSQLYDMSGEKARIIHKEIIKVHKHFEAQIGASNKSKGQPK